MEVLPPSLAYRRMLLDDVPLRDDLQQRVDVDHVAVICPLAAYYVACNRDVLVILVFIK